MRIITLSLLGMGLMLLGSFTKPEKLVITSPAFVANSPIPVKYTCVGSDFSPPLHIAGIPAGTQSLAIIVFDPDAEIRVANPPVPSKKTAKKGKHAPVAAKPGSRIVYGFTHWVIWNVDVFPDIPENFRGDHVGFNGAKERSYKGMCPPSGTHHYQFIVYDLDTKLNIDNNSDKDALEKVMEGHILGKGTLVGVFNKSYR